MGVAELGKDLNERARWYSGVCSKDYPPESYKNAED